MDSKPGFATLIADTIALSVAANTVIAVRLTKMAFGAIDPNRESTLMVSEKIDAAQEAAMAAARSIVAGEAHYAPGRTVAIYKRRVERNLRRLTSG